MTIFTSFDVNNCFGGTTHNTASVMVTRVCGGGGGGVDMRANDPLYKIKSFKRTLHYL